MLNAEGNIIKMVDSTGGVVVEYAYDAWGNPMGVTGSMASTLGADNPFRYRGYYYDEETGLYYLNQRYYNPEWSRFVNADTYAGTTGELLSHNVFAYCGNNPVIREDKSGRIWWLVSGLVGAAVNAISAAVSGADGADIAAAAIGGFASGVISSFGGPLLSILSGGVGGAVGDAVEQVCSDLFHKRPVDIDTTEVLVAAGTGAVSAVAEVPFVKNAPTSTTYGRAANAIWKSFVEIPLNTTSRILYNAYKPRSVTSNSSNRVRFKGYIGGRSIA